MKKYQLSIIFAVAATVFSGFAFGGEPGRRTSYLQGFESFMGTWCYEGPLLADVPGVAHKGGQFSLHLSWKWILDRQAVMHDWEFEVEGGPKHSGKALIGRNAEEKKTTMSFVDSAGGTGSGKISIDRFMQACDWTLKGMDAEGKQTLQSYSVIRTGKDTIVWQTVKQSNVLWGGIGRQYTLKRVDDTRNEEAAHVTNVPQVTARP